MTIAGGPPDAAFLAAGFVLEPVTGILPADAERAINAIPGPRTTATIAAYCLEQSKAVPRRGTVYRLAPSAAHGRFRTISRVMSASERLRLAGRLVPDTDPDDYFHSIRQWAVWVDVQGIRTETEFGRALIADARKSIAAAGERWTREIEDGVRAATSNRWQDVSQILALARRP
jgi:hypothetical protein